MWNVEWYIKEPENVNTKNIFNSFFHLTKINSDQAVWKQHESIVTP